MAEVLTPGGGGQDQAPKQGGPPRPPRSALVQLAGFAMIAAAIYFGLRARGGGSAPAAAPPSSAAAPLAAPPPAATAGSIAPGPSPEQMRLKFTPEAQAALDAQKPALGAACLKPAGGKPPRRDFAIRTYFGPDGEEQQQRRAVQTSGPEDADLIRCLIDPARPRLHVTNPGVTVGVQISLSLP